MQPCTMGSKGSISIPEKNHLFIAVLIVYLIVVIEEVDRQVHFAVFVEVPFGRAIWGNKFLGATSTKNTGFKSAVTIPKHRLDALIPRGHYQVQHPVVIYVEHGQSCGGGSGRVHNLVLECAGSVTQQSSYPRVKCQ